MKDVLYWYGVWTVNFHSTNYTNNIATRINRVSLKVSGGFETCEIYWVAYFAKAVGLPGWQRATKAICLHGYTMNIKIIMAASIFTMYGPKVHGVDRSIYVLQSSRLCYCGCIPSHGQCDSNYHDSLKLCICSI